MKRGRKSGWQLRSSAIKPHFEVEAVEPSQYEVLLASLEMRDTDVIPEMRSKTLRAETVKRWAAKHRGTRYVPETVLEYLGMGGLP